MSWVHKKLQQVGSLKRGMLECLGNHSISTGEFHYLRRPSKMNKSSNFKLVEFVISHMLRKKKQTLSYYWFVFLDVLVAW